MTTPVYDATRTIGDALMLEGELDGDNLPLAPAWVGASAKINIRRVEDNVLVADHVAVVLDTVTRIFTYVGVPLTVTGLHRWEIEITFPGIPNPISWPNGYKMTLLMIDQVG